MYNEYGIFHLYKLVVYKLANVSLVLQKFHTVGFH